MSFGTNNKYGWENFGSRVSHGEVVLEDDEHYYFNGTIKDGRLELSGFCGDERWYDIDLFGAISRNLKEKSYGMFESKTLELKNIFNIKNKCVFKKRFAFSNYLFLIMRLEDVIDTGTDPGDCIKNFYINRSSTIRNANKYRIPITFFISETLCKIEKNKIHSDKKLNINTETLKSFKEIETRGCWPC